MSSRLCSSDNWKEGLRICSLNKLGLRCLGDLFVLILQLFLGFRVVVAVGALENNGGGGDGSDVGLDLTGGYYDAGDHVKFGFPMAFTATMLGWGLIDFEAGHSSAGQLEYGRAALRWATDYFLKCHSSANELWGQVGDGYADHAFWGRPEDMTMYRPAYKIDTGAPGSDLAGETAAALYKIDTGAPGSDLAGETAAALHAQELYSFADQYRAYGDSIWAAADFYRSWSGYGDELCWSSLWLYRATGDVNYLNKAKQFWGEFGVANTPSEFSWDNKNAGSQALFSMLDGGSEYTNALSSFLNSMRSKPTTPGGMVYVSEWGSARHAANVAFIALMANKVGVDGSTNYNWGKQQIDYLLGTYSGRPFVVGYGSGPERPHHRSSSCPDMPEYCDGNWAMTQGGPNPQTLYGALVGGPGQDGSYTDDRNDYVKNEVACDYNAAFTGALAALAESG
uniref:Endoglucanase n=1 Tax=Mictyris platycheles TaxID=1547441 RepID=A0A1L2YWF1_9EUCA|nr:endo-beta-1,4-glucanase [Mictyris platycheles]